MNYIMVRFRILAKFAVFAPQKNIEFKIHRANLRSKVS